MENDFGESVDKVIQFIAKYSYAIYVVKEGDVTLVRKVIEQYDFDPSYNDNHLIQLASTTEHLEIILLLLKYQSVNPSKCIDVIIDKVLIHKNCVSFNIITALKYKVYNVISTHNDGFIYIPRNNNDMEGNIRRNDVNMFMQDYSKLIKQINKLFKQHNICNNVINYIWQLAKE